MWKVTASQAVVQSSFQNGAPVGVRRRRVLIAGAEDPQVISIGAQPVYFDELPQSIAADRDLIKAQVTEPGTPIYRVARAAKKGKK